MARGSSDEYWTPQWVFDALDMTFDLDVASPVGITTNVPADTFYTKEDDGMSKEWFGTVWMNPPFSETTRWVRKFIEHGNGACLVPSGNGTWMNELWDVSEQWVIMPRAMEFERGAGKGSRQRIHAVSFGVDLSGLGRVR